MMSFANVFLTLFSIENNNMYLDTLVLLFEAVAKMIDRQESIIEYHYGVGSMLTVIQRYVIEQ